MNKPELKYLDQSITPFFTPNGRVTDDWQYITTLNDNIASSGPEGRVGRTIHVKSVHVKGLLFPSVPLVNSDTSAFGLANVRGGPVRVAIVHDKHPNGMAPNAVDIWDYDPPDANSKAICAFRNLKFGKRFKILHNEVYYVGAPLGQLASQYDNPDPIPNLDYVANPYFGASDIAKCFDIDIKLKGEGIETVFKSNNGGDTNVMSGGISLWVCGIWPSFTFNDVDYYPGPILRGYCRIRFTDAENNYICC